MPILNSTVTKFFVHSIASTKQNGYFEYKPMYLTQIPIPKITEESKVKLDNLLDKEIKKKELGIVDSHDEVNKLVYQLYDLTDDEIEIIESAVG